MTSTPPTSGECSPASIETQIKRRIFKIIVIGDSNVGKTCLTFRFCGGKFPERTEATIGVDFRERTLEVDGETIKEMEDFGRMYQILSVVLHEELISTGRSADVEIETILQLWDTAGQERFRKSMVQHYYRNVHAVVFVYDVSRIGSFDNLPHWVEECDTHHLTAEVPRILVGNKCDLKQEQAVSTNMAQRFADLHNMPLFETSAKDDSLCDHVDAIFMTLAHKLKNSKPMMPPAWAREAPGSRFIDVNSSIYSDDDDREGNCSC